MIVVTVIKITQAKPFANPDVNNGSDLTYYNIDRGRSWTSAASKAKLFLIKVFVDFSCVFEISVPCQDFVYK